MTRKSARHNTPQPFKPLPPCKVEVHVCPQTPSNPDLPEVEPVIVDGPLLASKSKWCSDFLWEFIDQIPEDQRHLLEFEDVSIACDWSALRESQHTFEMIVFWMENDWIKLEIELARANSKRGRKKGEGDLDNGMCLLTSALRLASKLEMEDCASWFEQRIHKYCGEKFAKTQTKSKQKSKKK